MPSALGDAEKIVRDMLAGGDGFREVDLPKKKNIVTASFDASQRAMQLFRSLRTNPVMKFQNPWVAENWPRSERTRGKVVSKSKNLLVCEIGCVEANDVKVNYRLFKVRARVRVAC